MMLKKMAETAGISIALEKPLRVHLLQKTCISIMTSVLDILPALKGEDSYSVQTEA